MKCNNCNEKIENNINFCPYCGIELKKNELNNLDLDKLEKMGRARKELKKQFIERYNEEYPCSECTKTMCMSVGLYCDCNYSCWDRREGDNKKRKSYDEIKKEVYSQYKI